MHGNLSDYTGGVGANTASMDVNPVTRLNLVRRTLSPPRWLERPLTGAFALASDHVRLAINFALATQPQTALELTRAFIRYSNTHAVSNKAHLTSVIDNHRAQRPGKPMMFVGNHPRGLLDSMHLMELLLDDGRMHPKVVATRALLKTDKRIKRLLEPHILNVAKRRDLARAVPAFLGNKDGNIRNTPALVVFPAGRISAPSTLRDFFAFPEQHQDREWGHTFARWATDSDATIVPFHTDGKASDLFLFARLAAENERFRKVIGKYGAYALDTICMTIETDRQLNPKRREEIGITFREALNAVDLPRERQEAAAIVRKKVYAPG